MPTTPADTESCPSCGFSLGELLSCPQCNFPLSNELILGWSPKILENQENLLNQHRQYYFAAALRVASVSGGLDQKVLLSLTNGLKQNWQEKNFEMWTSQYIQDFRILADMFRILADQQKFGTEYVEQLVSKSLKRVVLCDCSPEKVSLITLVIDDIGRVKIDWEKDWSWADIITNPPSDNQQLQLLLAGDLTNNLDNVISTFVKESFSSFDFADETILICSRLYDWKHTEKLVEALEHADYSVQYVRYNPESFLNIQEYIAGLINAAPLGCSLYILTAEVDLQDGRVSAPKTYLLAQAKAPRKDTSITVKSYNDGEGTIGIVVVASTSETPIQSWELPLGHLQEAIITFSPSQKDGYKYNLSVHGKDIQEKSIDLTSFTANIPSKISSTRSTWHVVILIDTIADASALEERCTYARKFIELTHERLSDSELSLSVYAYGDHNHQSKHISKIPPPVRSSREHTISSGLDFIGQIQETPAPVDEMDFESSLEEALLDIVKLFHGLNGQLVLVTIGHRPPHPKEKLPGETQMISHLGVDWNELVNELEARYVKSFVILCEPVGKMPRHGERYAGEFWNKLGYNSVQNMNQKSYFELVLDIIGTRIAKCGLKLPVIINKSTS